MLAPPLRFVTDPKGGAPHSLRNTGLDGTEDDYLFIEESNSEAEKDTDFDDVPEDMYNGRRICRTFPVIQQ
ncbi:hypothetical protein TNCV_553671 [Trichonephila clavipes]|nr:hypothetical protein TNCV_553671 [Trichonephila clavipes]